jgi:predicted amidophosphoribosyltransferase
MLDAYKEWARSGKFDTIVCAPSRRHDAEAFASAIRLVSPDALDLTLHFAKLQPLRAGTLKEVGQLLPFICCTYRGSLANKKRVAIIDDVYSQGLTAACVLVRLQDRGLTATAKITICAPLWMSRP